jgi:hypothetical protein
MRWIVGACGFSLLIAALIVSGTAAWEGMEDTCTINPGDTIYVDLPEIGEGMSFGLEIRDAAAECENGRFEISAENFTMPCTMEGMSIEVQADEATEIGLECMRGSDVRSLSVEANSLRVDSYDCEQGVCDSMKVYGTSEGSEVNVNMTMEGTLDQVEETNPGEFSFELYGVSDGTNEISVTLDGTEWIREITVQSEPTGDGECRLTLT